MQIAQKNLVNFYILFAFFWLYAIMFDSELIHVTDGLGFDGLKFWKLTAEYQFSDSNEWTAYYLKRSVPSFTLRFGIGFCNKILVFLGFPVIIYDVKSIIEAFKVLNIACLLVSAWLILSLLDTFMSSTWQKKSLAIACLLLNFGSLKMPFFCPVLTDSYALLLGTLLLYTYLHKQHFLLILISFLGYFTFPPLPFMSILLILFPYQYENKNNIIIPNFILKNQNLLQYSAAFIVSIVLGSFVFYIFSGQNTNQYIVNGINAPNNNLLYLSMFCLLMYMFWLVKYLFLPDLVYKAIFVVYKRWWVLLLSVAIFLGMSAWIDHVSNGQIVLNVQKEIPLLIFFSVQNPLIFLIAHVSYLGIFVFFIIFNYQTVIQKSIDLGLGYYAILVASLLFSIQPESRKLTPLLPFFILAVMFALEKYQFGNFAYVLMFFLQVFISKIWYPIYQEPIENYQEILKFPWQHYFMNIGPWMSNEVYYIKLICFLIILGIFYFLLKFSKRQINS